MSEKLSELWMASAPVSSNLIQEYDDLKVQVHRYKEIIHSLQLTEERYRKIVDAISNYTYVVDLKDGLPVKTLHSAGCLQVTGYAPDDFRNDSQLWIRMVYPEDRLLVRNYVALILSSKTVPPIEHRIVRKDGAIRWIKNTTALHHDNEGQLLFYNGVIEDVTERKQWEMSVSHLASIVDSSEDAIIGIDLDGIVVSWNKGAERIFEHRSQNAVGNQFCHLIVQPPHIQQIWSLIEEVKKNLKVKQAESVILQNSRTVDVALIICPIRHINTRITTGISLVIRDITERKSLEKSILEASDQEKQQIGQDLHDGLCQELAGIAFQCEVLEKKLTARGLAEAHSVEKIVNLVNNSVKNTRDIARVLAVDELAGGGIVRALDCLVSKIKDTTGLSCQFSTPCGLELNLDYGESYHLYRIVQEALQNAMKHSRSQELGVDLNLENETVKLTVWDRGVGFSPQNGEKKGMGLKSLYYRARLIHANLSIGKNEKGGTSVTCALNLKHKKNEQNGSQ